MAITLVAPNFYPVYAGPAIRFSRYLSAFPSRGIGVRVLTGTPEIVKAEASGVERDWGAWSPGELLPPVEVNGAPVHRVRLPDEGKRRRERILARRLVRLCRRSGWRPDLVQLLSCDLVWVPALLGLRRLGIPTVYTTTMVRDLQKPAWKRALLRRHIAWPIALVNAVVVSSEVMRSRLAELGVRRPIHVIPNGVDIERFRPPRGRAERESVREELGIAAGDMIVLFVGPIVARKGVDLLLEAWGRFAGRRPGVHLVLAGPRLDVTHPANTALHRRLCDLVETSGAPDRVHFTGMVENVEDFMRAADIFVFPSRREGMPNVVPEAMASGLPVVMTPFLGLPTEFGQPGDHYLLAEFDRRDLATKLERLIDDSRLRTQLGRSARAWVKTQLEVSRSVDSYARLYRDLVDRGAGRRGAR